MAKSNLPGISSNLPGDVRAFLDRVREFVNGAGNTFVRTADLVSVGVIRTDSRGAVLPADQGTESRIPPPAPTGLVATGAMTNILLEWDTPDYFNHAYTEIWASGTDDLGTAVVVGTASGRSSIYPHSVGAGEERYYWIRFVSTADIEGPFNATAGVHGATSNDPAWLLGVLTDQISEDQLTAALNARIDLVDDGGATAESVTARIAAETAARVDAINIEARARIAQVKAASEAALQNLLNIQATRDELQNGIALAQTEVRTEVEAGISAEATARLTLQTALEAADAVLTAAVETEATARSTAVSAEATARETLAAQLRGSYEGADLSGITTGLLYSEREARVAYDTSLSQQITLLSAGSGDQFDWQSMWYFDTDTESWTGNGTPTAAGGFIRPADHATDPYIESPTGIGAVGATYAQVRLRIRKTGSPVWEGYLWWNTATDVGWDSSRRISVSEPTYDGGIGYVTFNPTWTGTIDQIRLDLTADADASNYTEVDWVAIGRPAPGASSAEVFELQYATVDMANTSSLAYVLDALETTVTDPSTGLAATRASLDADYYTSAEADAALAGREEAIAARYGTAANKVFRQATEPAQGTTYVTTMTGTVAVDTILVGDIWYDTDDGNKPYVWTGSAWSYNPDTSASASTAFIDSLTNAFAAEGAATISDVVDATVAVLDGSTGLAATLATAESALDLAASESDARAADIRTLSAQTNNTAEAALRGVLGLHAQSTALALARQELTAEATDGIHAEAAARTLLSTTVDSHTSTLEEYGASIDGVRAIYTVKLDVDGVVSGYGLMSEVVDDGTVFSKAIFSVDEFAIIAPGRTVGTLASVPFAALTSAQTINGVDFEAGVYIDGASINSGTIGDAQIGNVSADKLTAGDVSTARLTTNVMSAVNASVEYLDAGRIDTVSLVTSLASITDAYITNAHITDGTITFAKIEDELRSTNYSALTAGFRVNKDGTAEFNELTARGTVQSGNYSSGVSGWIIDETGTCEFNAGTFRGALDVASATSGQRLTIQHDVIKVYDAAGVLRVKLGNLSA